jgi:hypothetical protein
MRKFFSFGKWDVEISSARCAWTHFKILRMESGRHIVWGKLSITVEDGTLECIPTCAQCGSFEAKEVAAGDEGWTVCPDCRSVEGGYKYITTRQAGL